MTTPYFVPDEALKASMINAALRGVRVQLIVPHQLDNALVAAASRAHFAELLDAGVEIWQHAPRRAGQRGGRFDPSGPGLLHAKAAVIDDEVAMIGSANLDMRSFWLNFECTLFIYDHAFASRVHALQDRYMAESARVDAQAWARRPAGRRLLDHAAQLLGPLL
jgi:cardiolipin synthase A/B